MKTYKGSFTVEAACIFPLVLMCICLAIRSGIFLHEEFRMQIMEQEESAPLDLVKGMYQRVFVKDILGE